MGTENLHRAMLRPDFYPSEEGPISFVETHVSRLYFTRRHVYKVKKPVDFGFLNFSTLDRRRFYCEEEVRLNRRFAPGVYLGVVDIRQRGELFELGGDGRVVEYAVRMERLPAERMLDRRIAEEDPQLPSEIARVGRRLGELHRESVVCRNNGRQSNLEVVRLNWRENFEQTHPFCGKTLDARALKACRQYVEGFLGANAPLMLRREEEGWVRDGHGDLHAEHICLTDPVKIYDCIEFNRRFRIGDVAADVSFVLMDLDLRGRRDLSASLLRAYDEVLGEDAERDLLLPFYKIYRAWVRGKVESFLSADEGASEETRSSAGNRARRHFSLALGYLSPSVLVLTCGLMGTGKSTLGRALALTIDATMLRSDEVRKELAGGKAASGSAAPFDQGIYSPDFSRLTYDRLLDSALEEASEGRSVIVDASFARHKERERFLEAARMRGLAAVVVFMECDRDCALERLDRRRAAGGDPSDGRRELYDRQAAAFERPGSDTIRVDTTLSVDYNVQFILAEIIEKFGKEGNF
jgi:uncharacterized protein